MSCVLQTNSFEKADLDFMSKAIISLVIYLSYCPNPLSAAKDALYMIKTIASLLIACNKSKITQVTYFNPYLNCPSITKNTLYVAKTVASLLIISNKSKITQRSYLINKSHKVSLPPSCMKWSIVLILGLLLRLC